MFRQISIIDDTGLTDEGIQAMASYGQQPLETHTGRPETEAEVIVRIGDADAILLSWRTRLSRTVFESCPQLNYVGLCASLYGTESSIVDVIAARDHAVTVRGVRDYGDQGVVEFIIAHLIARYMGFGCDPWLGEPSELGGRTIGIIGFGTTGQMLSDYARALGMEVRYFSRTRKVELESEHVRYRPIKFICEQVDILSTHLPRGTRVIGRSDFEKLRPKSILVNTSLGPTFDEGAFGDWIRKDDTLAIFDADGADGLDPELLELPNVIASQEAAGWTTQARSRLTERVIRNIEQFLADNK